MDRLYSFQAGVLKSVSNNFSRYLFQKINWKQRMFAIRGLRGTGKTTMLLQYLKFFAKEKTLYVTADHPWFYENTLFELADQFEKHEGKVLLIDEIHKYPKWSTELKNIYDGFPALRIIYTASSALQIQRGEADLSRRTVQYELAGLSLREYLELYQGIKSESYKLTDVLQHPEEIVQVLIKNWRPLPTFKKYLKHGYFPFGKEETEGTFAVKLNQVINTVLETDLAIIEEYSAANVVKLKMLLGVISESVPFTPNISALAAKMKLGRDTINNYLLHLERARILNLTHQHNKGVAALQKPDKVYLENTTLSFALRDQPDIGSLRETFFFNQLKNSGHEIALPKEGDFLVDGKWTFEIGGKTKKDSQLKTVKNGYLALDEIESPYLNRIPLWLLGFLY